MSGLEENKLVANEIFDAFIRYNSGKCSYDRALEDAARVIEKCFDEKPIIGYIKTGTIKKVLQEVNSCKKVNPDKSYMFDCQIHQNEMQTIERILKA